MGPLYIPFRRIRGLYSTSTWNITSVSWLHPAVSCPWSSRRAHGAVRGCRMTDPWALFFRSVLGAGPFATRVEKVLFSFLRSDQLRFPDELRQRTERSGVTGATRPSTAYGPHPMFIRHHLAAPSRCSTFCYFLLHVLLLSATFCVKHCSWRLNLIPADIPVLLIFPLMFPECLSAVPPHLSPHVRSSQPAL